MTAPESKKTRISIDVICDRIESLPEWRRFFAVKARRGDLLQMYLNEESCGFSDAEIARHLEPIAACEQLIQITREALRP